MFRYSLTHLRRRHKEDTLPRRPDRRRFPRSQVLARVEYAYQPKAVFITGLAYNNSRGGILLGSDFPFAAGENLRIKFFDLRSPFLKKEELFFTGLTCWAWDRTVTSVLPAYEAGVRFDKCISCTTMQWLNILLHFKRNGIK